ncbi:MAG: shikimate dehydrogenase [Salinibacterium sp.]|nr:shikimate dehydrogenase [Salinibacterium sp.]MBF0673320.1 shikimate dehydrogenase [Salinibacterium sp.]
MTITVEAAGVVARRRAVLIGLIGEGITQSLTPPMHELEGARHGMHYVYRTIDLAPEERSAEHVAQLLWAARRMGFTGLNITHPIKQAVIQHLHELAPSAQLVGAVNTVVFDGERMIGHNTDVTGFGAAFDDAFGVVRHGRVVLVGAGGAGAAVASALAAREVAELVIVDVDVQRAESLASSVRATARGEVRSAALDDLPAWLAGAAGVVNATPWGMAAHPGTAFDTSLLSADMFVADIVYRPVETQLLHEAKESGCRTMSGLGMAMHQAADAFEIFTGEPADRGAMLADLKNLVAAEATGAPAPVAHQ